MFLNSFANTMPITYLCVGNFLDFLLIRRERKRNCGSFGSNKRGATRHIFKARLCHALFTIQPTSKITFCSEFSCKGWKQLRRPGSLKSLVKGEKFTVKLCYVNICSSNVIFPTIVKIGTWRISVLHQHISHIFRAVIHNQTFTFLVGGSFT